MTSSQRNFFGLRTCKDVIGGKSIRQDDKGFDVYEDYFSESDVSCENTLLGEKTPHAQHNVTRPYEPLRPMSPFSSEESDARSTKSHQNGRTAIDHKSGQQRSPLPVVTDHCQSNHIDSSSSGLDRTVQSSRKASLRLQEGQRYNADNSSFVDQRSNNTFTLRESHIPVRRSEARGLKSQSLLETSRSTSARVERRRRGVKSLASEYQPPLRHITDGGGGDDTEDLRIESGDPKPSPWRGPTNNRATRRSRYSLENADKSDVIVIGDEHDGKHDNESRLSRRNSKARYGHEQTGNRQPNTDKQIYEIEEREDSELEEFDNGPLGNETFTVEDGNIGIEVKKSDWSNETYDNTEQNSKNLDWDTGTKRMDRSSDEAYKENIAYEFQDYHRVSSSEKDRERSLRKAKQPHATVTSNGQSLGKNAGIPYSNKGSLRKVNKRNTYVADESSHIQHGMNQSNERSMLDLPLLQRRSNYDQVINVEDYGEDVMHDSHINANYRSPRLISKNMRNSNADVRQKEPDQTHRKDKSLRISAGTRASDSKNARLSRNESFYTANVERGDPYEEVNEYQRNPENNQLDAVINKPQSKRRGYNDRAFVDRNTVEYDEVEFTQSKSVQMEEYEGDKVSQEKERVKPNRTKVSTSVSNVRLSGVPSNDGLFQDVQTDDSEDSEFIMVHRASNVKSNKKESAFSLKSNLETSHEIDYREIDRHELLLEADVPNKQRKQVGQGRVGLTYGTNNTCETSVVVHNSEVTGANDVTDDEILDHEDKRVSVESERIVRERKKKQKSTDIQEILCNVELTEESQRGAIQNDVQCEEENVEENVARKVVNTKSVGKSNKTTSKRNDARKSTRIQGKSTRIQEKSNDMKNKLTRSGETASSCIDDGEDCSLNICGDVRGSISLAEERPRKLLSPVLHAHTRKRLTYGGVDIAVEKGIEERTHENMRPSETQPGLRSSIQAAHKKNTPTLKQAGLGGKRRQLNQLLKSSDEGSGSDVDADRDADIDTDVSVSPVAPAERNNRGATKTIQSQYTEPDQTKKHREKNSRLNKYTTASRRRVVNRTSALLMDDDSQEQAHTDSSQLVTQPERSKRHNRNERAYSDRGRNKRVDTDNDICGSAGNDLKNCTEVDSGHEQFSFEEHNQTLVSLDNNNEIVYNGHEMQDLSRDRCSGTEENAVDGTGFVRQGNSVSSSDEISMSQSDRISGDVMEIVGRDTSKIKDKRKKSHSTKGNVYANISELEDEQKSSKQAISKKISKNMKSHQTKPTQAVRIMTPQAPIAVVPTDPTPGVRRSKRTRLPRLDDGLEFVEYDSKYVEGQGWVNSIVGVKSLIQAAGSLYSKIQSVNTKAKGNTKKVTKKSPVSKGMNDKSQQVLEQNTKNKLFEEDSVKLHKVKHPATKAKKKKNKKKKKRSLTTDKPGNTESEKNESRGRGTDTDNDASQLSRKERQSSGDVHRHENTQVMNRERQSLRNGEILSEHPRSTRQDERYARNDIDDEHPMSDEPQLVNPNYEEPFSDTAVNDTAMNDTAVNDSSVIQCLDIDGTSEVHIECIKKHTDFEYFAMSGYLNEYSDADDCIVSRVFQHDGVESGEILLRAYGLKPVAKAPEHALRFVVMEGKIRITINDDIFMLKPRDTFHVPANNAYTIENIDADPGILHYCIYKVERYTHGS